METLSSYLTGAWQVGTGRHHLLVNPATEEPLAQASSEGLDLGAAVRFARERGGPVLRAMTAAQRGEMLRALSKVIHAHRDELIELAIQNGGNTRSDAKFDIDGASGTLAHYAELATRLGEGPLVVDGDGEQLGRSPRLVGQHVFVPRAGVAVHVNAFNFPAWGLGEKAACALLAGMPVITKPATSTALLAVRIVRLWVEAGALPEGALQLVAGSAGDLLTHLGGQDVLAFTGSGDTAAHLRALRNVVGESVRVNVEADSLNAAVLGPDVEPGSPTYDMFLRDVVRDVTQKTGQKCTAIRRVVVPASAAPRVTDDLAERLRAVRVGNPAVDGVSMGPLATAAQLADVRAGIDRLATECERVVGAGSFERVGVPEGKGYFVPPTLLRAPEGGAPSVHAREVFGPVATVIPSPADPGALAEVVARGGGGLVASIYSDDRAFVRELVLALAPLHGRLFLGSEKIADQSPGPGTVLPQLVHGGPGRAGGGEELGGVRGLAFYMQRTALQGSRPVIEALLGKKG